jgi:hypothetical protein
MPGPSNIAFGSISNSYVVQVAVAAGAAIGAATTVERTYTVPGLVIGDVVNVNKPQLDAGLALVNARVSAADTLALQFANVTAGALSITASNYLIQIDRSTFPTVAQIPTAIA